MGKHGSRLALISSMHYYRSHYLLYCSKSTLHVPSMSSPTRTLARFARFSPRSQSILSSSRFPITRFNSSSAQTRASRSSHHTNFYRTHGRALFKSLTMAFLSYQIFYWIWTTLETETLKDEKNRTIKGLEEEVKLLSSGVGSHSGGKRLLDEQRAEDWWVSVWWGQQVFY